MRLTVAAIVLASTSVALVQTESYTIEIQVDRPVLEPGEFARVILAPAFDTSRDWAMAAVSFDLAAPRMGEGISGLSGMPPWDSMPSSPIRCDIGLCGFLAGQLNFPAADIYADPSSPLPAFEFSYMAPDVSEPAEVVFETRTNRFDVYPDRESSVSASRLDEFTEGSATILVVPCRADFDLDGELNIFDFLAFQNAFVTGDPMADFDFDGELTLFDFLAFQNRFDQGC
ncbi:MAG: hypothetical protein NCW75_03445 [Phycisphaera sp.]|nr:MAG: hypothetical protein NCW75_03445 [Phycisphaera sp.]